MFQDPQNSEVTINGGNFFQVEGNYINHVHYHGNVISNEVRKQEALKKLFDHIAPGAFHNSAERHDPPKCHPQTRQAVLRAILTWAKSADNLRLLMCIYGPAGAGKSAIMQTIAELCQESGIVCASFFFFRAAAKRNIKTHLVTTLAYQLALKVPGLGDHVTMAIHNDPSIFSQNLVSQMTKLIIGPMGVVAATDPKLMEWIYIILVDGLDECSPEGSHEEIITMLAKLPSSPFKFLIASRPEYMIRETFSLQHIQNRTQTLPLDATYKPDADIEVLLRSRISEIKMKHPLRRSIPKTWPNEDNIRSLVRNASGQFIYAATVIKFLDSPRHSPIVRLNTILDAQQSSGQAVTPFAQLDALYHQILASVVDISSVINIMHCINYLYPTFRHPQIIEIVLEFYEGETSVVLCDMHSLLRIGGDDDEWDRIWPHHASLQDFLLDPHRSKNLYVQPAEVHAFLGTRLIRPYNKLVSGHFEPCDFWNHLSSTLPKATLTEELSKELFEMDIFGKVWVYDFREGGDNDSAKLLRGLGRFYSWLNNQHVASSSSEPKVTSHHSHAMNCLDTWLTDIIQSGEWSSNNNWLIFLVCLLRLGPSAKDALEFLDYVWDQGGWDERNTGFIHALNVVVNNPNRKLYQMLDTPGSLARLKIRMSKFYLEHMYRWIKDGTQILFNAQFRHWLKSETLLPMTDISKEIGNLLSKVPFIDDNIDSTNFFQPYLTDCTSEEKGVQCAEGLCLHIRSAAILSLKNDLRRLSVVANDYLERYGIVPEKHDYCSEHHLCFSCHSNEIFLTNNGFGKDIKIHNGQ